MSYFLLFALALETIIVYNIESLSDVRAHFSSMRAASRARAKLRERKAQKQRERLELLNRARGGSVDGEESAAAVPNNGNSSSATTRDPLASRISSTLLSLPSMHVTAIRRPWASRSAPSSSLEASAALAMLAEEGRRTGTGTGGGAGGSESSGGSSSAHRLRGESGLKADADAEKNTTTTATTTPCEPASTSAAAAGASEREETKRLEALDAEIQRGYHSWLSWCIDLSCACIFGITYVLAAVLIFVISSHRAPNICKLAGVTGTDCDSALALERNERNGI